MTTPREFLPTPRGWTVGQVAHYLGLAERTFSAKRPALEASGFPRPDPITARWDGRAVERWLDARSGLDAAPAEAGSSVEPAVAADPFMEGLARVREGARR